ncbi:phytoene dehydrogenase-like protein [Halopolyspora algeriensis]|uniref:Phytoene dehydrogenase-like protein n=1 Tax=Halopolyspora algeriensis TaxID=1500506 RepID=A0A368VY46_9ACTN|nr:NAD(P)/FAD-dependent oxidoreductase [Halopolyspora algeriensis]RCW46290.1 phytoene dehydrogenase-like protein [Halopolyspora algeriensis]TQM55690.1 phytoene dehydrogenase-like protein [Halopolyspora algeriensis]
MSNAIVVGSGPNGLAAAVTLARQGFEVTVLEAADNIGGGTRTGELTVPGVRHDHCSAVHPLGAASPFLRSLPLRRHGLEWLWPEIDVAHPLDSGSAGVLVGSPADTASGLGVDGPVWRALFEPLASGVDDGVTEDIMRPVLHAPKHPVHLARFGLRAVQPAAVLAHRWRTDEARGLFAGVAAHVTHPLTRPVSSAVGLMMTSTGHRFGWPVARGGSSAITGALAGLLTEAGGTIETGVRVRSFAELPPAEVVMLDLPPREAATILGDRLPARIRRAYTRYRRAPAAFKVDLAVEGGVPWRNEACRRAGTVHLGGTFAEIAAAERDAYRGRMPERPFVLVAQQYLADPGRSSGDVHPVWSYAHVPHGYTGDATGAVLDQFERFAPGVRERIVASSVRSTADLERENPNYAGGDIIIGANTALQLAMRPRVAVDPYRTGVPGVFLCSAATPPGGGVHGMCGFNAARSALRSLRTAR